MMSKPFQILGALALLAWTGVGAFMWMEVKNHLTVTIEETSDGQSDEAALLADRMAALSDDLDSLIAALDGNFALVGQAIGQGATDQAVRSAVIEQRLEQLEAALPDALQARETASALRVSLAQVETILRLANEQAAVQTNAALVLHEGDSRIEPDDAALTDIPAPADPLEEPPAVAEATEPAAPAATKTSFLAFKLPSRDFQFDGEQTFEILGDLSRVGFDAKSTLHDFSGVSNLVSGNFRVDLAHPDRGLSGSVSVKTKSLSTDLEGRDEAMLEHLGAEEHPTLQFVFESFAASSVDAEARTLAGTVTGQMTINGTTKTLEMKITAHVDESRRLVVEGEVPLSRADYNVHVPGKLGLISTDDEVRIWIHLRSRAKAEKAR